MLNVNENQYIVTTESRSFRMLFVLSADLRIRVSNVSKIKSMKFILMFWVLMFGLTLNGLTNAQTNPTPPTTGQPTTSTPAGTNQPTQQTNPNGSTSTTPPNSGSTTIRPGNEAQQSTQPQNTQQQQQQNTNPNSTTQSPRPQSPQITTQTQQNGAGQTTNTTNSPNNPINNGATTTTTTTTGTGGATNNSGTGATPTSGVGLAPGIAPAELPADPPPIAPNFEAPLRPLPSAERIGVDVANQMPLTLNDAIGMALQNNNNIDASRINVEIAEFGLRGARGIYDPLVSSENYYERSTTPTSSIIGGAGGTGSVTQVDYTGAARLGGFSRFGGGSYQADFSSTRLLSNNQNVTLNPQFPTALTFTYTQPLFRGLRFDNNRRNIEIAKKNISLSDAQFRQQAIEVIAQVQQAYWDLAFALRNLQVQIDAVKQARTQVESNQRLVSKGVLAPIDIVAANTQVTTFEQNIYTAQENVTRAENTLKTLILAERTATFWSSSITPVTPVSLEPPKVDLNEAVAGALKNRPEIAQFQANSDINKINEKFFRDLTKPRVDLIGTYTSAGLAGIQVPANPNAARGTNPLLIERINTLSTLSGLSPLDIPTTNTNTINSNLVGGYTKSLSNLLQQDYPTYRVGVRIELPFRNSVAKSNLGLTLAQNRSLENQRAQTEQIIESDVRNALQSLRSAEARLQAAAASRSSSEQLAESEARRLKAGTTTVFLVLQRQTELLAARGNELQAQTALNKAIAEFQRATGNTLEINNVSVIKDKTDGKIGFRQTAKGFDDDLKASTDFGASPK
ncbi:MAG: TolC family protein [Pyrinomonadaceae bacterium]|nr:TolC family protein [Pyrinomonadaceae bacterium]